MEIQRPCVCLRQDTATAVDEGQGREERADEVSEWQPIETAPKDGTAVDLWVKRHEYLIPSDAGYRVTNAHWGKLYSMKHEAWIAIFETDYDLIIRDHNSVVTHWMEIAKPPVTVASK